MSYKYINPGYAVLCEIAGIQFSNDTVKNPYNDGISFYTNGNCYRLFKAFETSEIWGKFGFYYRANAPQILFLDKNGVGIGIDFSGDLDRAKRDINGAMSYTKFYTLQGQKYYEIGIHIKVNNDDLTKSTMETYLDGKLIDTYTNNFLTGNIVDNYISCGYWGAVSNIIISDTAFDFTEKIGIAPVKSTEATMTANTDGTYTSTAAGQNVYQSIDTDKIKTDVPNLSKITGLAIAGNPAYFTSGTLNKIKMQTKINDTVDIKDTVSLTTTTTAGAMTSWGTDYALDDLKNIELGIESAE